MKTNAKMIAEMAALLQEAMDNGDKGMKALAAAIAVPIKTEVDKMSIAPLLFTEHLRPVGESATYQIRSKTKAYWIDSNGDAIESEIKGTEVTFPDNIVASTPMVKKSTLKHGNIGTLVDIQKEASTEIRTTIDTRAVGLISDAVEVGMTVTVTGGALTSEGLNEAMSRIEDLGLSVKYLVMRGSRLNDMKNFDLDPVTARELNEKGIFKSYNGAQIINFPGMDTDEVLIIPNFEIGKMGVREDLTADTLDEKKRFMIGWLIWKELAMGIVNADKLAKVVITA